MSVEVARRALGGLLERGRVDRDCPLSPRLRRRLETGWRQFRSQFDELQVDLTGEEGAEGRVALFYQAAAVRGGYAASWPGCWIVRLHGGRILEVHADDDPWRLQMGDGLRLPTDSVAGCWEGDVYGLPFLMRLEQTGADGAVRGVLESHGQATPVQGHHHHPCVEVQDADGDFLLRARWSGWDELVGRIAALPRRLRIARRTRPEGGRILRLGEVLSRT